MLFFLSILLISLLYLLNKKWHVLCFIFLSIIVFINIVLYLPKEAKDPWVYDFVAVLIVILVYVFSLIGTNLIMKVAFNRLSYREVIRKICLGFGFSSSVFFSYLFFIKGVIYD